MYQRRITDPVRLWVGLIVAVLVIGAFAQPIVGWAADPSRETINKALISTVKLWTPIDGQEGVSGCSGTVIDPAGTILTAFHCVGIIPYFDSPDFGKKIGKTPGQLVNANGLVVVGPTIDAQTSPKPTYIAQVAAGFPAADIAVLKIIGLYDAKDFIRPLGGRTSLPALRPGNSASLQLDDDVFILAYPGIGGTTLTYTRGKVSGFEDINNDGQNEAIKHTAVSSQGASGGLVMNDKGDQIGVVSYGVGNAGTSISRFIGVDAAKDSIAAAARAVVGLDPTGKVSAPGYKVGGTPAPAPAPAPAPGAAGALGDIRFGSGAKGTELTGAASNFPANTPEVFAAFKATGIERNAAWGYVWTYNGEVVIDERNSNKWEGSTGTTCCLSINNGRNPLPSGTFDLTLLVNNAPVTRASFTVGSGGTPAPAPAPAAGVTITGKLVDVDTKRPVADGIVGIGPKNVNAAQWQAAKFANEAAFAESGRDGAFVAQPAIEPGARYTIVVLAQGYRAVTGDLALNIPANASGAIDLGTISLKKE